MRRIALTSPALSCLVDGPEDGPLVLCLHGFPDVPRSYEGLLAALASRGYRAVAPWMPGYAPSSLEGPFDPATNASRVLALADRLSPDRPVAVVGHDWGAVVTYQLLADAPARFTRAVTMAVPHPLGFAEGVARHPAQLGRSWYMGFFQIPLLSDAAVRSRDLGFVRRLWASWSPGYRPPAELMDELEACLVASLPGPLAYYREAGRALLDLARGRGPSAAGRIAVPTLYLHGADDGCIGVEMMEGQARFFEAELREVVIAGAGHFLHLERPAEVQAEILAWIGAATPR